MTTAGLRCGVFALALVLGGCGGGGGGGAVSTPPGTGPQTGLERLTITVPAKSSSLVARTPRYISSLTQSVTITVAGSAPVTFNLTPSNANCTTGSAGLTCVITFPAAVGTTTVQFATFASTDGSGTPLSVTTIPVAVTAGQVNDVTVTLNGVVKSVALFASPSAVTVGTAATVNVSVSAMDAGGAVIAGPGNYSDAQGNPVTLTLTNSDNSGAAHLSQSTFAAPPSTAVSLSYSGAAIADVTLTLSGPGVTSATAVVHVNPANTQPLYVATRNNLCATQPDAGDVWNYSTLGSAGGVGQLNSKLKLSAPRAVAFTLDRLGYEDVLANPDQTFGGVNAILRYTQGQSGDGTFPVSVIQGSSTLLNAPIAIAADSAGGVWVAQRAAGSQPAMLMHFPAGANGNVAPDRTITAITGMDPNLTFRGTSVAVDSHDNIYTIADSASAPGGRVYELAAASNGAATAIASYPFYGRNLAGDAFPAYVSIDQHTDAVWLYPVDIFAGDTNVPPNGQTLSSQPIDVAGVERFPQRNPNADRVLYGQQAFPSMTPGNSITPVPQPASMAFDDTGNVYVEYGYSQRSVGGCLQTRVSSFQPAQHGNTPAANNAQIGAQDQPIGIGIPYTTAPTSPSGSSTHASGAVAPSPASMSFVATGAAYGQPLHVTESGYAGTFTATSGNTAVATVSPSSSSGSFTVTTVGAGNTTIVVADGSGNAATVPVTSTITAYHLRSHRR